MVQLNFDSKTGILHGISSGEITLEGMFSVIDYMKNHTELPRNLLVLEDARNTSPQFQVTELSALAEKIEELIPLYNSIKHAVVHQSPGNTAYALLFSRKHAPTKYKLEVFSTIEGARSWLLS